VVGILVGVGHALGTTGLGHAECHKAGDHSCVRILSALEAIEAYLGFCAILNVLSEDEDRECFPDDSNEG
jgi:hypothetical protein